MQFKRRDVLKLAGAGALAGAVTGVVIDEYRRANPPPVTYPEGPTQ